MFAQAPAAAPSVEVVSTTAPQRTTLEGEVRVTVEVFVSEGRDFAVLRGRRISDGDDVVVVGPVVHLSVAQRARIRATVESHPRFGSQLRVSEGVPIDPTATEGVRHHLRGIRNIGTALTRARRLCVLVGNCRGVAAAVRSTERGGCHSGLAERLGGIRCRT